MNHLQKCVEWLQEIKLLAFSSLIYTIHLPTERARIEYTVILFCPHIVGQIRMTLADSFSLFVTLDSKLRCRLRLYIGQVWICDSSPIQLHSHRCLR